MDSLGLKLHIFVTQETAVYGAGQEKKKKKKSPYNRSDGTSIEPLRVQAHILVRLLENRQRPWPNKTN